MEDRIKLFSSPVIAISQEKTLQDALFEMRKKRIRHLIVTHKVYPVGIVTERDIARFLEEDKLKRNVNQIQIQDCMVKNVIKVVSSSKDFLKNCAQKMNSLNIGSVVVVDEEDQLVGIVTKSIFVHNYPRIYENKFKVSEYMSAAIITCRPDDEVKFALKTMKRHQVSRLMVTDNKGFALGIVTYQDFLNSCLDLEKSEVTKENIFAGTGDKQIFDVMEKNVLFVKTSDDMSVASRYMEEYNVSGLPVVDNGILEGVVSSSDIVKIFAS